MGSPKYSKKDPKSGELANDVVPIPEVRESSESAIQKVNFGMLSEFRESVDSNNRRAHFSFGMGSGRFPGANISHDDKQNNPELRQSL